MIKGFREFILRGNVIDLAIAVVIGAAFGAVVTALVEDIITPLIGAIFTQPDFSAIMLGPLKFGSFINALLTFLIIAAVVYFLVVVPMNRLLARFKTSEPPPQPKRTCPECLSEIPVAAHRCAFCTAVVPPVQG